MTDLVERLRDGYAGARPFPFPRVDVGPVVAPTYAVKDHEMRELFTALTAKDKEIEALRERVKELEWPAKCNSIAHEEMRRALSLPDDAPRRHDYYAACIEELTARAETAERERDEARAALKPFAQIGARWSETYENDNAEIVVTVASLRAAARAVIEKDNTNG